MTMKLYAINDDPHGHALPDEAWWCAVWAESLEDAVLLAASRYDGGCAEDEPYREQLAGREIDATEAMAEYRPMWPRIERNPIVLRLAGWREEGERLCDSCGLASLGMARFEVCPECYQCKECGCTCDEDAAIEKE